MKNYSSYSLLLVLCLLSSSMLQAQKKSGFYVMPGLSILNLITDANVTVGDTAFPDADFVVSDATTFSFNVGYFINENYSLDLQLGLPPSSDIFGSGTIEGFEIGNFTYAPTALTINRHFKVARRLDFFLGAGISYTFIQDVEGVLVDELNIENFISPVVKAGFNIDLSDRFSLVGNVVGVWGRTTTTGFLNPAIPQIGGAPFTTEIDLRPIIFQSGLRIKF